MRQLQGFGMVHTSAFDVTALKAAVAKLERGNPGRSSRDALFPARWHLHLWRVRGGAARPWLVQAPGQDGRIAVADSGVAVEAQPARRTQAA
jgi:hypothetical protein